MANSASMPLAPTTIRCHLSRRAQALEASTNGSGVKTRKVTPIWCTSPPVPVCAPEMFARKCMAHFVDQFHDDKRRIQQGQVLRVQDARGLRRQRFDVATDGPQPDGQDAGPQDRTGHGERFADDTHPPVQKSVRVPQRNADEKEIPDGTLHLAPDALLVSLEERLRIGGQIALQQIRGVELTQQLDHLALGRRGIAEAFHADPPHLADGASAVKHGDKMVGRVVQTKVLVVGRVLQNVPSDAAEMLTLHGDSAEQSRGQLRDAVPGLAECGTVNAHLNPCSHP